MAVGFPWWIVVLAAVALICAIGGRKDGKR